MYQLLAVYLTAMDHAGPLQLLDVGVRGRLGGPASDGCLRTAEIITLPERAGEAWGSAKAKCSGFLKKSWTF